MSCGERQIWRGKGGEEWNRWVTIFPPGAMDASKNHARVRGTVGSVLISLALVTTEGHGDKAARVGPTPLHLLQLRKLAPGSWDWERWYCSSLSTALWRAGSVSCLGGTVELRLVVGIQVSQPWGCELTLPLHIPCGGMSRERCPPPLPPPPRSLLLPVAGGRGGGRVVLILYQM